MAAVRPLVVLCAMHLVLAVSLGQVQASGLVLRPAKTSGPAAGLVFIQMEDVTPATYEPIMTALQGAFNGRLWIAVPSFVANLPTPLQIGSAVSQASNDLSSAGLPADSAMFYGGHGGGGAILQSYIYGDAGFHNATGQLLFGAFLKRQYINGSTHYPVPTLTVGGELDGLVRCTRLAQGYWHQVLQASSLSAAVANQPIVLNMGQNHMQFCSGTPPAMAKANDFKPEISDAAAYQLTAEAASEFMAMRMGDSSAQAALTSRVQAAGAFFAPIIEAMEQEGSYHFKPPCYSNPVTPKCTKGCQWTQYAQTLMGNLSVTFEVEDSFHPVWKIPFHLPKIWTNCSSPSPECKMNITTVSQCTYEQLDSLDTGLYPVTAHEIRAKMKSRQAVWMYGGIKNANFSITDAGNLCADINQVSYRWAMAHAAPRTLARFNRLGEPYTFGPDIAETVGPLWIWTAMKYESKTGPAGQPVTELQSIMMKTPDPYWITMAEGYHYCKLLSPARAMEWLYVDGLRAHDLLG